MALWVAEVPCNTTVHFTRGQGACHTVQRGHVLGTTLDLSRWELGEAEMEAVGEALQSQSALQGIEEVILNVPEGQVCPRVVPVVGTVSLVVHEADALKWVATLREGELESADYRGLVLDETVLGQLMEMVEGSRIVRDVWLEMPAGRMFPQHIPTQGRLHVQAHGRHCTTTFFMGEVTDTGGEADHQVRHELRMLLGAAGMLTALLPC